MVRVHTGQEATEHASTLKPILRSSKRKFCDKPSDTHVASNWKEKGARTTMVIVPYWSGLKLGRVFDSFPLRGILKFDAESAG